MRILISTLFITCFCVSAKENIVYAIMFVIPTPHNNKVQLTCLVPHSPSLLPRNEETNALYLKTCVIVPKTRFTDSLENYPVDFINTESLKFDYKQINTPYPKNYFRSDLPVPNGPEIIFGPVIKLREMSFGYMEVPPLPSSAVLKLESLTLKFSSLKSWTNCEHLKELFIEGLQKDQLPNWPDNCTQLKILRLESMTPQAALHVTESMSKQSVVNLEFVSIVNCSLKKLPLSLLMHSVKFKQINLSYNNFDHDALLQFPTMKSLDVLDLSNNNYFLDNVTELLSRLPGLRELNLNSTGISSGPSYIPVTEALTKLQSLTTLYIRINMAIEETFMHSSFTKLNNLSMAYYKHENDTWTRQWNHLRLHSLPSTQAEELYVDVRGVNVKYVSIGPEYFENFEHIPHSRFWLTNKGYKLTVYLDNVDCDCNNHMLKQALRIYPHYLSMPDLKCHHGGLFIEEPAENLNCRKATTNGCIRRLSREQNYTTVVDCSYNTEKFRWPQPRGFQGFNASGNWISSLDKAYLPDSLEWLDLRNNNISRLGSEQSMRLFGNKGRRVWLTGNRILCDCDNQPLLNALHINQSLVMDFDNLTCFDSGQLLRLVSVDELCRPRLVIVSVTISMIAVLLLVAALLIRHYWTSLRIVLYAHGFCLSCLREEELDKDRPYDAFVSFAHGDDQYVMEKLLPKLESEPNNFKICVHYRDWRLGEWIPEQIMQSVRLSKRTIIVLSKNFVRSSWGVLEFRHANAGAAADGRKRLLVLILDDVLAEALSPELQCYLESNTYLDCKDSWFWEKLIYAMPHKEGNQRYKRDYNGIDMCTLTDNGIVIVEKSSSISEEVEHNL